MTERAISREVAAAAALKQTLLSMGADEETLRDTIEGETNLHNCIASVVNEIRECEIIEAGLSAMLAKLQHRQSAAESRRERLRASVEQAMMVGEIRSLTFADCTISLKAVPPKLVIEEESLVPAQYWKPSDPKLDRKAVTDALKAGAIVPGATMGNGSQTIQIRRT